MKSPLTISVVGPKLLFPILSEFVTQKIKELLSKELSYRNFKILSDTSEF